MGTNDSIDSAAAHRHQPPPTATRVTAQPPGRPPDGDAGSTHRASRSSADTSRASLPPQPRCVSPKLLASRSEEHPSELQSLMRISYDVFFLKKKIQRVSYASTI